MSLKEHVFLFTGEEQFLLFQELKRRKKAFIEKYGAHHFFSFDAGEDDLDQIFGTLLNSSLFAEKNCVLLNGIPVGTDSGVSVLRQERFEKFWKESAERIPSDTTLIFVSPKPDKRKSFVKNLVSQITVKEFPSVKNQEKQFVLQKMGSLLSNNQINLLVQTVGKNLGNLDKECDKILLYTSYHVLDRVSDELLLRIVFPHEQVDTFKILEHWMSDTQALNSLFDDIRMVGVQWNLFFGSLYYSLKNALLVGQCVRQGIGDVSSVAKVIGVSPFVLFGIWSYKDRIVEYSDRVLGLYQGCLNLDFDIKSGKLPESALRSSLKILFARYALPVG